MGYVGWGSSGATESALVTAVNSRTHQRRQGVISCGSYLFPFHVLALDKYTSLVMAEREPKVLLCREGLHQGGRRVCGFHHGEQTSQCDGLEDLSVGL